MDERDTEESDELDLRLYRMSRDAIENILTDPPPPLVGDINFEETPGGFEVHYSDRNASSTRTWLISPPTGRPARCREPGTD